MVNTPRAEYLCTDWQASLGGALPASTPKCPFSRSGSPPFCRERGVPAIAEILLGAWFPGLYVIIFFSIYTAPRQAQGRAQNGLR